MQEGQYRSVPCNNDYVATHNVLCLLDYNSGRQPSKQPTA